jgi:hypothetical protein
MVNKLFKEYLELFSFKNVFFNNLKRSVIYPTIILIFSLILILIIVSRTYEHEIHIYTYYLPILLAVPVLKSEIKRIVNEVYGCKTKEEFWEKQEYEFIKKLKTFSIETNNSEQLKILIKKVRLELEDMKPVSIIKGGFIMTIIAPMWIAFLNKIFSFAKNIQDVVGLFLGLFLYIFIIYIFYRIFIKSVYYDFKYSKYRYMKEMLNFIEELHLKSLNEKVGNTKIFTK